MIAGVLVTLLFAIVSMLVSRHKNLIPNTLQAIVEKIVEGFLALLQSITGDIKLSKQILPLIGTIFLFFGVSNIITLLPGLTSITYEGVSVLRTPTNDFNMTFSVALAIVIVTQIMSMQVFGFFGHIGKFVKIKEVIQGFQVGIGAGMLAIVDFCIGLLDIISEFAKVISLSLRLFGNMYAGEILAGLFLGTFALLLPAPWLGMNLLVGILHALVFGALTAAYYTLAVQQSTSNES